MPKERKKVERRSVLNPGSNREQVGSPTLYQLSYGTDKTDQMNALCRFGCTVTNFVRCAYQQMIYAVLPNSVHFY